MPRKNLKKSFKKMVLMPVNRFHNARVLSQGYEKLAPPPRPPITPALIEHRKKMSRKNKRKAPPRPPITDALRRHREMLHRQQKRKAPPPPLPKRRRGALKKSMINSWARL